MLFRSQSPGCPISWAPASPQMTDRALAGSHFSTNCEPKTIKAFGVINRNASVIHSWKLLLYLCTRFPKIQCRDWSREITLFVRNRWDVPNFPLFWDTVPLFWDTVPLSWDTSYLLSHFSGHFGPLSRFFSLGGRRRITNGASAK